MTLVAFLILPSCKQHDSGAQTQKPRPLVQMPKIESYPDLVREVDHAIQRPYDYDSRMALVKKASEFLKGDKVESIEQLFKLMQYSGAADSENIGEILRETFYSQPKLVVNSLNTIDGQLLESFRNNAFHNLLVATACSLPLSVTEAVTYTDAQLSQDKERILEEVNKTSVASTLKMQVVERVKGFKLHHE